MMPLCTQSLSCWSMLYGNEHETYARNCQMNAAARTEGADRWFAPLLIFDILAALAMVGVMWTALLYAGDAINLAGVEQVAQRIF